MLFFKHVMILPIHNPLGVFMKSIMLLLAIASTLTLTSCASNKTVANNEDNSAQDSLLDIAEKAQDTSALIGEDKVDARASILNDSSRSNTKNSLFSSSNDTKKTNKAKK
jgi:hypothetical protein